MRAGAVPVAQRPADAFEDRHRLCRQRRLVHRPVNLRRRPAWKRPALGRLAVAAGDQYVDGHARLAARGPAWRARVRHLHPQLPQAPRLVHRELASARVGRLVHLDHHVRQDVLTHHHDVAGGAVPPRIQVHGLIRLHDAPRLAVLVPQQEVRRAEGLDGRAARQSDQRRHLREPLRRMLVIEADGLAHHRGLGGGVPDLDAALVVVDLLAGDMHRHAAREILGAGRWRGGRGQGGAGGAPGRYRRLRLSNGGRGAGEDGLRLRHVSHPGSKRAAVWGGASPHHTSAGRRAGVFAPRTAGAWCVAR